MRLSIPTPLSFSSFSPRPAFPSSPLLMSLFVVSLTTVLVTLRPKRRKDEPMKPPTKDEMHANLPCTMPKRQLLRDLRRLMTHAKLPSARPARQPTRDLRRLLKHGRLPRARRVKVLRDLRRPPRHRKLPRTRFVSTLTRDPRRLLRRRRLPRTRSARLLTREPRRPQKRGRPLRRLPLRELRRLLTLWSMPRRGKQTSQGRMGEV